MNTFDQDIKNLVEVNVDHAEQAINSDETATFFIGRQSCPYCRKFAPKIAKVAANSKTTVYFINSEKVGQEKQLAEFRSLYKIPTVPGLIQVTNGQVKVRCDSSMTEEEIKAFTGI